MPPTIAGVGSLQTGATFSPRNTSYTLSRATAESQQSSWGRIIDTLIGTAYAAYLVTLQSRAERGQNVPVATQQNPVNMSAPPVNAAGDMTPQNPQRWYWVAGLALGGLALAGIVFAARR